MKKIPRDVKLKAPDEEKKKDILRLQFEEQYTRS